MDDNGAVGHRSLVSEQALLAAGEAWLEVLRSADDAAVRALRDWERAEEERSAIEEIEPQAGADLIADARERLRSRRGRSSGASSCALRHAGTRRDLYVLATTELLVAEDHDAKLELLEAARTIEASARSRVAGDVETKERTGIAALVPRGVGGPIPIVIDIGTETAAWLASLVNLPDDVQVIVVGGGSDVEQWVDALGPSHAAIVDLGALV